MRMNFLFALIVVLGIGGCHSIYSYRERTSRVTKDKYATTIYRDRDSKTDYIQIDKVINSSCLCADAIAEKYVNGRIVYRLYYGCSIYKTRKQLFSYCSRGGVIGPKLLDGSEESGIDFETKLDSVDKLVLHKIDSFIQWESGRSGRIKLCKKRIEGFQAVECI